MAILISDKKTKKSTNLAAVRQKTTPEQVLLRRS